MLRRLLFALAAGGALMALVLAAATSLDVVATGGVQSVDVELEGCQDSDDEPIEVTFAKSPMDGTHKVSAAFFSRLPQGCMDGRNQMEYTAWDLDDNVLVHQVTGLPEDATCATECNHTLSFSSPYSARDFASYTLSIETRPSVTTGTTP